ncbi:metal-sensing transcriptional repressor [Bacillus sp. V3B]|nr:metal-sensing transcriptional repressor [Bacillus sp. V3B]
MRNHNHNHKCWKNVINRLARIEGHIRGVKQMSIEERDCQKLIYFN